MTDKLSEFTRQVLELSESKDFSEARYEWTVIDMYIANDDDEDFSCVCGHSRLQYIYKIKNMNTCKVLYPIGSECIKKFEYDKLDYEIKMFKQGDKIFINKGKKLDGLTYNEICKNHKNYIDYIKEKSVKSKYKKLINYYDFMKDKSLKFRT